ncbi:hypothetical protein DUI70_2764 [Streptomyces albus]|nr:hypothetical protein DUI70_2764 [Streptomyces albus]
MAVLGVLGLGSAGVTLLSREGPGRWVATAASALCGLLVLLLVVRQLRAAAQFRRAEHLAALDDLAAADRGVEAAVRLRPPRQSQGGYQGGYQAGYQQAAYQWAAQTPPPAYTVPQPTRGQQSPPEWQSPPTWQGPPAEPFPPAERRRERPPPAERRREQPPPKDQVPEGRVPPVTERPAPSQQQQQQWQRQQQQPGRPRDGGWGPAPDVESPVPPLADTGGYGYPGPSSFDYPLLPPLPPPPPPAYQQSGDTQDSLLLAALWEATHTRLRLYHETALKQANRSFRNAQSAMGTGFALLVVFTVLAVKAPTSAASIVSGALGLTSAGLAGYVSRTFIRSQEIAAGHLRAFFSQPLEFSRYLAAERLIADAELTSEQRAGILGDLVRGMVSPQVGDAQGQSGAQGFPGAQGSPGGQGGTW